MARPREFDRDKALAKARDVFWARGYEGTSIADLVGLLELAPARLYAAFGSKQELFREVVDLYEATEGGFVARALADAPTAREAVERFLGEAIDIYTRRGRPLGCLVASAAISSATENDGVRKFLAERRLVQNAAIIARLRRAVAQRELPPGTSVEALGDAISALLYGLSTMARDGVARERLRAMCALAAAELFPLAA